MLDPSRRGAAFRADTLFDIVEEQPDLILVEIVAVLRKRGIVTSRSSIWRFFQRHKVTLKKTLGATERDRPDVARARRSWLRKQRLLDATCLVFLDEMATNTKMARLMGRGPQGERVIGLVPGGHWETITLVAGLTSRGIVAPFTCKGAMDGPTFVGYIEQCLAPTLKRGQIVIMDNLPAHLVPGVREAIEAAGPLSSICPSTRPSLTRSSRLLAR